MNHNIVIVGGGPAGLITALTAKSVYPDKSVCLVKDIADGVIPCAIPYMMRTLDDPGTNAMPEAGLQKAGIEILVGRVTALHPREHRLCIGPNQDLSYEKLVLATGAVPSKPPIAGTDLGGVYTIEKSMAAMVELRQAAQNARHTVIIGGGFIGAEFADELSRSSTNEVHLVELMPKLLHAAFDDEFCNDIEKLLTDSGVQVRTNFRVSAIAGSDRAEQVILEDGTRLPCDLVLLSVGDRPATELAKHAGLRLEDNGSIWVDDYLRTSEPDVFAVGDCAMKEDFFTRRPVPVRLASTATAEARIAGTNLYSIRVLRQIQGTISAFSTRIGDVAFASAGNIERTCEREGFRWVTATASAPDRHPGTLPGARPLKVKLVFARRSGVLLGGQLSGGPSVGELINVIALGIQKRVTVRELDMMQIATHPLLTSAPTVHPLVQAAHQALAEMRASGG